MKESIAAVDFEGTRWCTGGFLVDVCRHLVLQGDCGHGCYNIFKRVGFGRGG